MRFSRWMAALAGGLGTLAILAARPGLPVHRLLYGARPGVRLDGQWVGGLYEHEVRALLQAKAKKVDRPAQDARMDPATGQIHEGRPGVRLDVETTLRRVMGGKLGDRVESVVVAEAPRWRAHHLAALTFEAGRFSTTLYGSEARQHNIRKALSHINNIVVLPGEVFSFNALMPEYTEEAGWRSAQVMDEGQLIPGVGGGVCQVSTTLYNAVLNAGLTVVERHPHSGGVPYVPWGRDACVAIDPPKDLRFRNDTPWPVLVKAWVDERDNVTVAIYTTPPEASGTGRPGPPPPTSSP